MSDVREEEFEAWLIKRVKLTDELVVRLREAFEAGWSAGVENYQGGEWDYE